MAGNFEEYNDFVGAFNKKYGTNFSFDEYDKEQRRFDNFSENFLKGPVNGVSNEDNVYRKEFLKIYKQYAESLIFEYDKTLFTDPNYVNFINDWYCKSIIGARPRNVQAKASLGGSWRREPTDEGSRVCGVLF